jgi:hypothetical protein
MEKYKYWNETDVKSWCFADVCVWGVLNICDEVIKELLAGNGSSAYACNCGDTDGDCELLTTLQLPVLVWAVPFRGSFWH